MADGAAPLAPPQSTRQRWHLLQITDCHLGADPDYCLHGVRTHASCALVLAVAARRSPVPDLLVATGDIAAAGEPAAYRLFAELTDDWPCPRLWLPGNHDDLPSLGAGGATPTVAPLRQLGPWWVLALNTAVPGQAGGALGADELALAAAALEHTAGQPTVIFMHHPPVAVGCAWIDRQRLADAAELAPLLVRHGAVKAVFCGHVHQEFTTAWAGTQVHTTPSTCFQFAANSADYALADMPPGFRWIDLHSDGRLVTAVARVGADQTGWRGNAGE